MGSTGRIQEGILPIGSVDFFLYSTTDTLTELAAASVKNKLAMLFSAAKYDGNPVEPSVQRIMKLWIYIDLKNLGLVHANRKAKPTVLPKDISAMLKVFFTTSYLTATMRTMRTALNVALSINLMLHCNNRISELMKDAAVPKDLRPAVAKANVDKTFTWRRFELYAFKEVDGSTRLQARVTFK